MAQPFDPEAIGQAILGRLSEILNEDIRHHAAFAERQAKMLATQAAMITRATIAGELDTDSQAFFLDDLKRLTANLARTLVGLTILTIEKAWNAIVGVLWGAINTALQGAGLPFTFAVPGAPPA